MKNNPYIIYENDICYITQVGALHWKHDALIRRLMNVQEMPPASASVYYREIKLGKQNERN